MSRARAVAMMVALVGLSAGTITTATAGAAVAMTVPVAPTLTGISAEHHFGHDALVFQFPGGVPAKYSARYVSKVIADPSVLSFGVGMAQKAPFHMYAQPKLGRVVLDIPSPYWTVPVRDYFLNAHRFATGRGPLTQAVYRSMIPPATAFGAIQRLFAGPTQAEQARGLKLVSSGATGFKHSFFNDQWRHYEPVAAADSWQRVLAFFAEHVQCRPPSSG